MTVVTVRVSDGLLCAAVPTASKWLASEVARWLVETSPNLYRLRFNLPRMEFFGT
jgi:hypothetical protein